MNKSVNKGFSPGVGDLVVIQPPVATALRGLRLVGGCSDVVVIYEGETTAGLLLSNEDMGEPPSGAYCTVLLNGRPMSVPKDVVFVLVHGGKGHFS